MDFQFEKIRKEIERYTPLYDYDMRSFELLITYILHSAYWINKGYGHIITHSVIIALIFIVALLIVAIIDKYLCIRNDIGILNKLKIKLNSKTRFNYETIKQILIKNGINTKEKSKFFYDYYINKQNNEKKIDFWTIISFLVAIVSLVITFVSLYNKSLSKEQIDNILLITIYSIVIGTIIVYFVSMIKKMLRVDNYEELCDILALIYYDYLDK